MEDRLKEGIGWKGAGKNVKMWREILLYRKIHGEKTGRSSEGGGRREGR